MSREKNSHTILTCYYRPKPGGFCKRLFRAIQALLDRGHRVHYLAVVPFPIDHPNCYFHRFPWPESKTSGYLFWGFFHFFSPVQLLYLAFRYRADRLFAFGYNYSLLLQPARLIKRIPLTLFLRGDTIENHRLKGRPSSLIFLEHILEGLGISGTRMYGVSEVLTQKTLARHRFFKPDIYGLLRNDIVVARGNSIGKKEFRQPLHLACVGVLEPGKNQGFLFNVMQGVPAEKAQLYLYGTGPDEQLLRERVKNENLSDRVHFMGWVQSEKIWPNVDLLLMPSLHEGAPNAVLEALGAGVPVLASDIPEHTEILLRKSLLSLERCLRWVEKIKDFSCDHEIQLQQIIIEQEIIVQQMMFDWDGKLVKYIV